MILHPDGAKKMNCDEPVPKLYTERLALSPLTMKDADALFAIWSNAEVMEYLVFDAFRNLEQAYQMIEFLLQCIERGEGARWTISLRDSGRVIGTCGFHNVKEEHRRAEIGYEIAREQWGKGLMSEALRELLRFCFEQKNFHRLEALVTEGNERSLALLRRAGFQEEGVLRDYEFVRGRFQNQVMLSLIQPAPPAESTAQ